MTFHKIFIADSRDLSFIPTNSIQLIVTSPPYWQLKDYGSDRQIGFADNYETYINNLNLVWRECERVLSPGCRFCINIGDQFARSVYYGRYKVIPIRTEIIRMLETLKLDYMGAVIWQKTTTMNTTGGGAIMGSYPYPRNGILKIDYEFILIFKKQGDSPKPTALQKANSKLTPEEWKEYFSSHWAFPGVRQAEHLAMFPEELPKRLIKMFTFEGETVLDPFLGSGTTSLAALNQQRNSIGIEINQEYIPVIRKKIEQKESLFQNPDISIGIIDKIHNPDYNKLPYLFKDPHELDNKVDIKKLHFGSVIDKPTESKETLYRVKQILSPEKIMLENGLIIKLIGIKEDITRSTEAMLFLQEKLKNHKIFIRFGTKRFDSQSNLLGYVYLENKTFMNMHLLRSGTVNIDTTYEHKLLDKFNKLEKHV